MPGDPKKPAFDPDTFMQGRQPQPAPFDPDSFMAGRAPSFPHGNQPATLPNVTNEDLARWGRGALRYAPVAGAVGATALFPPSGLLSAAGIAGLGGVAGESVRQGVLAATDSPGRPAKLTDAALNMGESGLEQAFGEFGGRLLAKPLAWLAGRFSPTRLYGGALKPSPGLIPAERDALIQTGLRERIPVSQGGLVKLDTVIDDLNGRVQSVVNAAKGKPGMNVNPVDVTKALKDVRARFASQVNPEADVAAIDRARREFIDQHSTPAPFTRIAPNPYATPGGPGQVVPTGTGTTRLIRAIPLDEAQRLKRGTYRVLASKYGELASADTEAQKGLARGLKDEIARRVPAITPLNNREGQLIDLRGPLGQAVNREGNRNILGFRLPLVDTPELTSAAAIGMNGVATSAPGRFAGAVLKRIPPLPTAGKVGLVSLDDALDWRPKPTTPEPGMLQRTNAPPPRRPTARPVGLVETR